MRLNDLNKLKIYSLTITERRRLDQSTNHIEKSSQWFTTKATHSFNHRELRPTPQMCSDDDIGEERAKLIY